MRVLRRLTLALVAVVALAAVGAAAPTVAVAAKAKVAGTVVAVGGSKSLERSGRKLGRGAVLHVGDRLVLGAGVTATLRLDRPRGVSADADLVELVDARGTKHTVSTAREASGRIVVTIAPAA